MVAAARAPSTFHSVAFAPEYRHSVAFAPEYRHSVAFAPEYRHSVAFAPEYRHSVAFAPEYRHSIAGLASRGEAGHPARMRSPARTLAIAFAAVLGACATAGPQPAPSCEAAFEHADGLLREGFASYVAEIGGTPARATRS